MRKILSLILLGAFCPLLAQGLLAPGDPRWETIPIEYRSKIHFPRKDIKIFNKVQPLFWILDMDGDGLPDFVIALKGKDETESTPPEMGLWVQLSSKPHPIVLGCGNNRQLWKGYFFDQWSIFRRWQPIERNETLPPPHPKGDFLLLEREGVGSVILYWNGSRLQMYTQGQ